MKSVYKVTSFLLLLALIGYIAKYGLNVFLANHLPQGAYGDFSVALNILSITGTLLLLGSDTAAKNFLVEYLAKKEIDNMTAYIRWNLKLILFSIASIVIVFILATGVMYILHYYGVKPITEYHIAIYMLWIAPFASFAFLLSSYLLCNRNYLLSSIASDAGQHSFLLAFFVAAVLLIDTELHKLTIVMSVFVVFFSLSILQVIAFVYSYPKKLIMQLHHKISVKKNREKLWRKTSLKLALTSSLFYLITMADLLIVEIVGRTEVMVDYYAAILVICNVILFIALSTIQFIKPQIKRLLSLKKKNELQSMLDTFNIIQFSISFICLFIIFLYGKSLLQHFGALYVTAARPLMILSIGYSIAAISRTAVSILSVTGNENYLLYSSVVELLLLIVFCSLATYIWGIMGTSITTSTVIILRCAFLIFAARKQTGLRSCLLF